MWKMRKPDLVILAEKFGIKRGVHIKREDLIARINEITGLTE